MAELYTYAVSRIRAKETSLLSKMDLEQLLSAKSVDEAIRYLADKGFDGGGGFRDYNELLSRENEKIWELMKELKIDKKTLKVFLYKRDFHNLKSSIKSVYSGIESEKLYFNGGFIPVEAIKKAIFEKDFSSLPENMQSCARKALSCLLKTGDGQKCDMIIDKATLDAIYEAGKSNESQMIRDYCEITVALADIKIAVRGNALSKSAEFIKEGMAECKTVDILTLSQCASKSAEDLKEYIKLTPYSGAVEAIEMSYSEFEKWCDNYISERVSREKSNPFTIAPIGAYILARENEINAVRIILSGKANNLSEEFIRERLRELYV